MLVSVSFLKNKLGDEETIKKISKSNADFIHIDIMDGKFVPNKNYTYDTIKKYFINIKKRLDVHLMVDNPLTYIKEFRKLNPKYITFHIESKDNIDEVITYLKDNNIKVGIAIKPETRVHDIIPYLEKIDLVLVLGVNPGSGGQPFIEDMVYKIRELNALKLKYNYILSVDGGINDETIKQFNSDMVVVGSYITSSDNYDENITKIKKI